MELDNIIPIKTQRLLLGEFTSDDWKDLYLIEQSREQHRYNLETYNPKSETEVIERAKELSQQDYDSRNLPFLLAIRLRKNRQLIGFIGFKKGKLVEDSATEVYYSIYKDHLEQRILHRGTDRNAKARI